MTYFMKLPRDPKRQPTANGKVTDYNELSLAPWFGLPVRDPRSYPQNPCKPDSDSNSGSISNPADAGSAFMELQFYPPGVTPFADNISCYRTQWCGAITIDSLESQFNLVGLNPACEEPVNFAFLQRNGVPAGPPSPQQADLATDTPNAQTLRMNPGDVRKVSITDPNVFQTCMGGTEGKKAVGEGPCNSSTGVCTNATTEGTSGPVACPSNNAGSGNLCEYSDGECFQQGNRTVMMNGVARKEHASVTGCLDNFFQNGDLDFDGADYQANAWPNLTRNHPTSFRYIGPFDGAGKMYPQVQYETDAPVSRVPV